MANVLEARVEFSAKGLDCIQLISYLREEQWHCSMLYNLATYKSFGEHATPPNVSFRCPPTPSQLSRPPSRAIRAREQNPSSRYSFSFSTCSCSWSSWAPFCRISPALRSKSPERSAVYELLSDPGMIQGAFLKR